MTQKKQPVTFAERINRIIGSRTFLIVFSLLAAIAFWVYVEHIEPVDVESLNLRVDVQLLHAEELADRQLVNTGIDVERITLRFSGKRDVISKLYEQDAVRVTADLSNIREVGLNLIEYTISFGDGIDAKDITVTYRSANYISVQVEKQLEKSVPVTARTSGASVAAEGYIADPFIFSPETVKVYGPKAVLDEIDAVRVDVRRENLSKTVTEELTFVPVDADGDPIISDSITFDREIISVTIPIKLVKEVALVVNIIDGAGSTPENRTVKITPEKIMLSGDAEILGSLNSLTLATIDATKFEEFYSVTIPIVWPNDMTNLTGITDAEVTISIVGLDSHRLTVPSTQIQITNVTQGYTATLITTSVDVGIRGTGALIENITPDNIRIVVDLSELGETTGTFTVPAKVFIDGQFGDCGAFGEYKIAVRVTRDNANSGGS